MQIEEVLKELNFSDKEISVYLSLLELETAEASDIAEHTGLNRSTIYLTLEFLQKRGLVSVYKEEGSVTKFVMTPPERILQLVEESAKKYSALVGKAHNIMPELKSRYRGNSSKPKVRLFEGGEGLITAYEETLTSTEEILAYASIENMHKALPGYFPEYYKRRAAAGIPIKSIHPDTPEARERVTHDQAEKRNSALVPGDKYAFSPEINIFNNKIIFMSLVEKFALVIESQELADALKKIFDLSWQEAQRYSKKKK